jgi:hypothetical protein
MQLLLSLMLSIHLAASAGGEVIIKIPPGINVREHEIRTELPGDIQTRGSYDRIEIVIYYFSLGIEKFSYNENNAMQESLMKGEIKALIKLKSNNVLRKALFVAASGTSREQIINNFTRIVTDTLAGQ